MVTPVQQNTKCFDDDCEQLGNIWALRLLLASRRDIHMAMSRMDEVYELLAGDGSDIPKNDLEWRSRIASRLKALEAQPISSDTVLFTNVTMLADLVGLTPPEAKILAFLILSRLHLALRDVGSILSRGFSDMWLSRLLSNVLKIDIAAAHRALGQRGMLVQSGLVIISPGITDFWDKVGIVYGLTNAMLNNNRSAEELTSFYLEKAQATRLSLTDYPHIAQDISLLLCYLRAAGAQKRKGVNILFYGKPGSGKTQLALLLAKELRMTFYSVGTVDAKNGTVLSPSERCSAYLLIQRLVRNQSNSLLLFDETEDILGSGATSGPDDSNTTGSKAWINRLLEENPVPCIWIGNHVRHIDSAFLRR
jgi:hypothetical protein